MSNTIFIIHRQNLHMLNSSYSFVTNVCFFVRSENGFGIESTERKKTQSLICDANKFRLTKKHALTIVYVCGKLKQMFNRSELE